MKNDDQFAFIYKRGKTSSHVSDLVTGFKQMMEPYTYNNFRMRKDNTIHDLLAIASSLQVGFLTQFSSSGEGTNMHLAKIPHGPTLTFKLPRYTSDIQRAPITTTPLTVLSGFPKSGPFQLVAESFRNLFPSVDVSEQKTIDRVVVIHCTPESRMVQIRHYRFQNTKGVDAGILNVIRTQKMTGQTITDMLRHTEMDDQITELGPRLDLELTRILGGVFKGEVLYHAFKDYKADAARAKELITKAKRTAKIQREAEIREMKRRVALLKAKKEAETKKEEQQQRREEAFAIRGEMIAEKAGMGHLVGERNKDLEDDESIKRVKIQKRVKEHEKGDPERFPRPDKKEKHKHKK